MTEIIALSLSGGLLLTILWIFILAFLKGGKENEKRIGKF